MNSRFTLVNFVQVCCENCQILHIGVNKEQGLFIKTCRTLLCLPRGIIESCLFVCQVEDTKICFTDVAVAHSDVFIKEEQTGRPSSDRFYFDSIALVFIWDISVIILY